MHPHPTPLQENWPTLRPIDPIALQTATAYIHRAAQFPAMTGKHFALHQDDDSHTNFSWDVAGEYLVGHPLVGTDGLRAAIQPLTLSLAILDSAGKPVETLLLTGKTKAEGITYWKEILTQIGLDANLFSLALHYDMPPFETDEGAPFLRENQGAFQAFTHMRQAGHALLEQVASEFPLASPTATWPHHFDVGSYIPIAQDDTGMASKSLGIGMAIDDPIVSEPYLYVTHSQTEGKTNLAALAELPFGGYWQKEDFVMAILPMSMLYADALPSHQAQAALDFFETAIDASLACMKADRPTP